MSERLPSFAMMGSGGVGGSFGALLAKAGYPVTLVARGAHLDAIRKAGLVIEGPKETFQVEINATDDPQEIGPVDFVLFSVKLWDTEEAGRACRPLLGPDTAILSLQNGIDSEQILSGIHGEPHVLGGVAEISAAIWSPGRIKKVSPYHIIRFGELDGAISDRVRQLERALVDAGIESELSSRIHELLWTKFIFLVGISGLTALTRKPLGLVRADDDTRSLLEQVMRETYEVGCARGVDPGKGTVAERMASIDTLPAEMLASMAIDLIQGRRLELPWLSGAVVRLGDEMGVPTPANRFINTALKLDVSG